jgi:small subunit ribosomal protein S6
MIYLPLITTCEGVDSSFFTTLLMHNNYVERVIMKAYELMVIFKPAITEDDAFDTSKLEKLITKLKGTITSTDDWGEKSLAYPILGHDRGHYIVYEIGMPASAIKNFLQKLSIETEILRYLLVTIES